MTWLSAFLAVISCVGAIIAVVALVSGALLPGLLCVALTVIFISLRRIDDHNQETSRRLRRIELALGVQERGQSDKQG